MSHLILNDPIDVIVKFIEGRIHPHHVKWGKHTYAMKTVNLIHRAKEGSKHVVYFGVSDDTMYMKLRFDTHDLQWRLVEVYAS
ncbi:MAG: hypothetical protein O3B64_02680 [bacterium]|nr:hypothetical protein [bacterium]